MCKNAVIHKAGSTILDLDLGDFYTRHRVVKSNAFKMCMLYGIISDDKAYFNADLLLSLSEKNIVKIGQQRVASLR